MQSRKQVGRTDTRDAKDDKNGNFALLEGRKPILDALSKGRTIDKIFVKKGGVEGTLKVIVAKAREKGVVVSEVSEARLDNMAQSRNHQGILAITPAREYVSVADILSHVAECETPAFIMVLDGITDTYNLGAIIRTACAAGVHGVIIPKHRSATLTGQVAKASAGAVDYVRVARVTNISAAIEQLQQNGVWVYCAQTDAGDGTHRTALYEQDFTAAAAIVIGEEGEGVSRLVAQKCDIIVSVPMFGEVQSLNASAAAAVLMYEVVRQRGKMICSNVLF